MYTYLTSRRYRPLLLALISVAVILVQPINAQASFLWNWSYSGAGIVASGTLLTDETPDANGFYLITDITGTRNSETITGLQPTGTSIPGNEPFVVDNLIRPGASPQLTGDGFGFSTSEGNYSNPFFASFLPTPGYLEVYSTPSASGAGSELPIGFSATLVTISEPGTTALMLAGIALFGFSLAQRKSL
jgi:hypothetical protein